MAKELKPVVTRYKIDRTGSVDSVDCSGIRLPRLPVLTNPSAASQERPRVVDLTMVSDEVEVTIDLAAMIWFVEWWACVCVCGGILKILELVGFFGRSF